MTKVIPGRRKRECTPRVRTGCITCKGRHVKCGEEKPNCAECTKTGRKCEGYALAVSVWVTRPKPKAPVSQQLTLQRPSNNVFQAHELRSLRFFLEKTLTQIDTPFSKGLWSQTIPSIAQQESSIKHALIALSGFHERFMSNVMLQPELGRSALKHYNIAIRELLGSEKQRTSAVVGLLCCLLFFAAELLQGKLASAIQLFGSGRRIIHEFNKNISHSVQLVSYHDLFQVLQETFMRLEYHVSSYFVKLTSDLSFSDCYGTANIITNSTELSEEPLCPEPVAIFNSLPQALEELRRFSHGMLKKSYIRILDPEGDKQRLANWCTAFESLKRTIPNAHTHRNKLTIVSLEIWWRQVLLHILAVSAVPKSADPMWWDQHQTLLEEVLDYLGQSIRLQCADIGDASGDEKPSAPSFCMESGVVSHLMTIIGRCRDPYVRRRALDLLKLYNRQEGLLQRELTIDCCQRMIDLEERGREVKCAADIPAEARVVGSRMELHTDVSELEIKYLIGGEWITEVMTWSSADD